ncbi:MAG: nickel pincer cofactor biosynthesis protein LarB [Promethearchaeota archaeon]
MVGNERSKFLDIKQILRNVKEGQLDFDQAERMLKGEIIREVEADASLDIYRELRTGIPEVVFAENKTIDALRSIVRAFLAEKGDVIVSRITDAQLEMLEKEFGTVLDIKKQARLAVLKSPRNDGVIDDGVGLVAIMTAGTSDLQVAEEAATICELMGCRIKRVNDVGIAGIHRIFKPLKELVEQDVDVIVCCAGMEGALPSLVASLTDVIVIGVPVSTGYGFGGKGETALRSMLQSCSPGLVVVNIDNGIGACAAAALIAKKIGHLKKKLENFS